MNPHNNMSKRMLGGGIKLMQGKQKDWQTDLSKISQTGEKLQSLQNI